MWPDGCALQPVRCQAPLKSIHRVCLSFTNGCDTCVYACKVLACRQPTNYHCQSPRTAAFVQGDVTGHWRLTTPDGKSCELVLDGSVMLTASCLPIGEPVTRLAETKFEASELRFLSIDGIQLLAFGTQNPDDLKGVRESRSYRLVRLEPAIFRPTTWEGRWELRNIINNAKCQLILSMRNRQVGWQRNYVRVPHGIALMSDCVMATDDSLLDSSLTDSSGSPSPVTRIFGPGRTVVVTSRPIPLPVWTTWRTDASDIIFRDDSGGETVFKIQPDGIWRAQVNSADRWVVFALRRTPF
jgi:hypothetical protein